MRAYIATSDRGGGRLALTDIPRPSAGNSELLVQVHAAGVNHGDLVLRSGRRDRRDPRHPQSGPTPAGMEVAGIVQETGQNVKRWRPGDRVMGRCSGGFAEYAVVSATVAMAVPSELSFIEAAVLPVSYVVGHDAIVTNGGLRRGETVLVNAASSGVGTASIQIADLLGANRVIGMTTAPSKFRKLKKIGMTEGVTLTETDEAFTTGACRESSVDLLIDLVGGPLLPWNLSRLAIRGRMVTVGRLGGDIGDCDLDLVALKRARIIGVTNRTRSLEERGRCAHAFANSLLPHIKRSALHPVIDRVFEFEDSAAALDYLETQKQVGKVVIALGDT